MDVRTGQTFEVVLTGNAGSGYVWEHVPSATTDISRVHLVEMRPEAGRTPGSIGGQVRYRFVFQADHEGQTTLRFHLRRPWETTAPLATHEVQVTVGRQASHGDREVA